MGHANSVLLSQLFEWHTQLIIELIPRPPPALTPAFEHGSRNEHDRCECSLDDFNDAELPIDFAGLVESIALQYAEAARRSEDAVDLDHRFVVERNVTAKDDVCRVMAPEEFAGLCR